MEPLALLSEYEIEELTREEVRRGMRTYLARKSKNSWLYFHKRKTRTNQMIRAILKYTPEFHRTTIDNQLFTICTLRGTSGGIVSTGVAWLSPEDKDFFDTGFKIALARAVKSLVTRRLGDR